VLGIESYAREQAPVKRAKDCPYILVSVIITARGREYTMATAKDHISEVINRQPDNSSYDEIVRELAFDLMVQRGLKDSDERRTISNEEMQRRIKTWQK
jgi:hypothetical protein